MDNLPKIKLAANKFLKLIDQSDIAWFVELNTRRLQGGLDDKAKNAKPPKGTHQDNKLKGPKYILSYSPVVCPISNCGTHFLPNDMILHYLSFHKSPKLIQKVFENQRLFLTMAPFELISKEIMCLGLICYAGKDNGDDENLVKRNVCVEQNLLLNKEFNHLSKVYPIFVLASVVSMRIFSKIEDTRKTDLNSNNECPSQILIIWLAGSKSDILLSCTVTTYDEDRLYSRSKIVGIRPITEKHSPQNVCNSNDYFRLHFKELSTLVGEDMTLKLELIFNEN